MRAIPQNSPIPGGAEPTRLRILEAAAHCFAKYGFARTRMDDIAAGAGVSRALVHSYFGTKPKLLRAVQEYVIEEWSAALARLVDDAAGPSETLEAWVRLSLTDTRRQPLLRAIFAEDALAVSPGWNEVTERTRTEWLVRLGDLIARGIASGEYRSDLDVEASAVVLRTLQIGLISEVLAEPPRSNLAPERQISTALDLMLAGLRAGPTIRRENQGAP